jgi:hypothetical protein
VAARGLGRNHLAVDWSGARLSRRFRGENGAEFRARRHFSNDYRPERRAALLLSAALLAIRTASAKSLSSFASAAAGQFQPCSTPKAKLLPLFARALPRGLLFTPMRQHHGTTYMSVSKSNGSTINKRTRLTARARIGRKSTSAGYAALKSASTITLRAYLLRYAQKSSWREDNRRVSNGDQVNRVAMLAKTRAPE